MVLPNKNVYGNLITHARLLSTRKPLNKVDMGVQDTAVLTLINLEDNCKLLLHKHHLVTQVGPL